MFLMLLNISVTAFGFLSRIALSITGANIISAITGSTPELITRCLASKSGVARFCGSVSVNRLSFNTEPMFSLMILLWSCDKPKVPFLVNVLACATSSCVFSTAKGFNFFACSISICALCTANGFVSSAC